MSENESYVVLNTKESTVKSKKKAEAKEKKVNKKEEKSKIEVEKKEKKEKEKNEEEEDKTTSKKKVVLANKKDSEEKKKKKKRKEEKPEPKEKPKSEKETKTQKPEPKPDKVSNVEKPEEKPKEKPEPEKPEPIPDEVSKDLDLIFFEMIPERPVLKPRGTVELKFKNTGGFRIEMVISLYSLRMRLHNSQICENDSTVHRVVEAGATASVLIKDTGVYCGYESAWVPPYDPEKRDGQLTLQMASVDASVTEMPIDKYVSVCDREAGGYRCNTHVRLSTISACDCDECNALLETKPKKNVGHWTLDYKTFVTMEPESKSYKEQLERIKEDAKRDRVYAIGKIQPKEFVPPKTEESMKKRLEKRIAEEKLKPSKPKTEDEEFPEEGKKRKKKKRCIIS